MVEVDGATTLVIPTSPTKNVGDMGHALGMATKAAPRSQLWWEQQEVQQFEDAGSTIWCDDPAYEKLNRVQITPGKLAR
jgi:hypothetical protein